MQHANVGRRGCSSDPHRYIEWGACDPARFVFNPRFIEWFDACTAGLFEAAAYNPERIKSPPIPDEVVRALKGAGISPGAP
jgi:acyl-CoA thioesterase FadM